MHRIFWLLLFPLFAMAGQTVAVLNFNSDASLSEGQRTAFQQRLTSYAAENAQWTMIERNQMDLILQEQGFQQTGLCEKDCQLEMGRLLGADLLVMGSIAKMGKQWSLTASLVDVASGRVLRSSMADVSDVEDLVGPPLHSMVQRLMDRPQKDANPKSSKSSLWPWLLGGSALVGTVIAGTIWALPGKTSKRAPQELEIADEH